jgi:hypothetical protein
MGDTGYAEPQYVAPPTGPSYDLRQAQAKQATEKLYEAVKSLPTRSTYHELREQFQRLTTQRAQIDGKITVLSQLLSLFE